MRIAMIHNPVAGGRRDLLGRVRAELAEAGAEVTTIATTCKGDAEGIAAGLAAGAFDRIAVAGGDGTVNEVVNGLARHPDPPPLGLVPLGTANVLAAELGLAVAARPVARALLGGEARPVTLGEVNGRRFVLMAGAGLDAEVVARVSPALKRRLGRGAYVAETLLSIAAGRFGRFRVAADGASCEAASVVVANARHYGGPWIIAPGAGLERPGLDLCLFQRTGRWAAIGYAASLIRGTLPSAAGFSTRIVDRVTIDGPAGAPVQADGDIVATLPAEIRALPGALRLVFPDSIG